MFIDDSKLNSDWGWGTTAIAGVSGVTKLKNVANNKSYPLKNGWYYRYDIDKNGGKKHMHIYNASEDYSQNDDGSNHHNPKGGYGPPKSIQKLLKKQTGWDWGEKAENNANKAVVEQSADCTWKITYADGSVYNVIPNIYSISSRMMPTKPQIISYYYSANGATSGETDNLPVLPIPTPNAISGIQPVPIPALGI